MTAGNQYTADTINQQAAQAVIGVRNALAYAMQEYQWLQELGTSGITSAPAGANGQQIDAGDAATILAALADVAGLDQQFLGEAVTIGFGKNVATGTPYNYMTFGQQMTAGQ